MAASQICAIDGCGKPHKSRGWCNRHYRRWLKHGDTSHASKPGPKAIEFPPCDVKQCSKCGITKSLDDFCATKNGRYGRSNECRACKRDRSRHWYESLSPEARAAKIASAHRKTERTAWERDYRAKNKERLEEYRRNWRIQNIELCRAYQRKHQNRIRSTPIGKLRTNTSRLVHYHLRLGKGGGKTFSILGYSLEELSEHLERQFSKGMTWDNYGQWHVDHIRPLSSFQCDSADDPSFKEAWALSNLRPLWAVDNLKKHAKQTHLL